MYPEPIKRFISGTHTAEDMQYIDEWIKEEPEREQELKELKSLWNKTGDFRLIDDQDIDGAWVSFETALDEREKTSNQSSRTYPNQTVRQKSSIRNTLFKAAAVILLAVGLYSIFKYQQVDGDNSAKRTIIQAPMGEHKETVLQDGTKIILNADSEIRYDKKSYGKRDRIVHLTGEAFFEVNNEKSTSPFIVETNEARIRDISTKFNVRTYQEDQGTNVVVAEGEVEVFTSVNGPSASTSPVTLSEGKMVNVAASKPLLRVSSANLNKALAWLNQELIFEEQSFSKIVATLERFYAVNIVVEDTSLNSKKMTASFKNENLRDVLDVVTISLGAEYEVMRDSISIFKKHR